MAKETYTFETICKAIKERRFAPVYFLMGEEPFFIDKITDLLIANVLNDEARDFDQLIMYGADCNAKDIIDAARAYPSMMSTHRLVVVREAQLIKDLDETLENYVKKPLSSTVLVINYKYKKLDRRKSLAATVEKNGILFDSEKIRDYNMPAYIRNILKQRGVDADEKAVSMLAEYLGNDLSLIYTELDKLLIFISDKQIKRITPEIVEKNVGISKDFNNFELVNAIAVKDVKRANLIIRHFARNPKGHPVQMTLPVLFNYFSNLMICHYETDKSEVGIMRLLGFHHRMQTVDYKEGLRKYSAMKVFNNIRAIRFADAQSKGVDATSQMDDSDIMKELIYRILH